MPTRIEEMVQRYKSLNEHIQKIGNILYNMNVEYTSDVLNESIPNQEAATIVWNLEEANRHLEEIGKDIRARSRMLQSSLCSRMILSSEDATIPDDQKISVIKTEDATFRPRVKFSTKLPTEFKDGKPNSEYSALLRHFGIEGIDNSHKILKIDFDKMSDELTRQATSGKQLKIDGVEIKPFMSLSLAIRKRPASGREDEGGDQE